ncbi:MULTISPECIES: hypothetical protein [Clostridium]|uniref:hypothetical protein n=1 Tax=Clostridium TaxID=1485 RepID=UPI000772E6C9|nr:MULTISPECIES: hypothetical protein [Clostridium]AUM96353.1 hypothetical protein RSJ11_14845 [Clostridium sporogenes]AVQ53806.1 hypothetical protein C7M59_13445 [Clostridium botulinum]NFD31009.1 hypothetical protein [Clostridium botulinum]NFD35135.1 hypothetical protein [Clostridium botulinum]NFD59941.1 hypothetical protein [Clostridium botulinum]
MKQTITAYITALTNVYMGKEYPDGTFLKDANERFIIDLNNLLDFIADLKEEKPINLVLNCNKETTRFKKYIKELEETCEDNNEVIRKQFERIKGLEFENKNLKSRLGILDELESMEGIK